jgi:hypothetical protein
MLEDDTERVLRVHHVMRKTHAVEPSRRKQEALIKERPLKKVTFFVLTTVAIPEKQERPGVFTPKLLKSFLKL